MAFLIGFDKNRQNLEFKGRSKLSINFLSNYLYVEPENEECKLISASFEWNFVMKKNFLFAFAEFDFMDFCLVFKNEQICNKTYDYILSEKKDTKKCIKEDTIDASFIIPIFEKIAENPNLHSDLIDTIATWYKFLDEKDKEKYSNLMKEYQIYDVIIAAIQTPQPKAREPTSDNANNRKRKFSQIKKEVKLEDEVQNEMSNKIPDSFNKIIPLSHFQLFEVYQSWQRRMKIFTSDKKNSFHEFKSITNSQKNNFKCVKCEKKAFIDVNEEGEICLKLDSKKHSCKPTTKIHIHDRQIKFLFKPNFEIFENCVKFSKKVLIVYDSMDKSLCFEYYYSKNRQKYFCRGCSRTDLIYSKKPGANICHEGTAKEYVELINENHVCKKRNFRPEKFGQHFANVLKPDFEIQKFCHNGKEGQRLIIFDPNDRTKCYRYSFDSGKKVFLCLGCYKRKKYLSAKLRHNSDRGQYIVLSNAKHVCEKRNYEPEKYQPYFNYILKPNFEIQKFVRNGKEGQKLIIYDENDRTQYYQYYDSKDKKFCCRECQKMGKYVSAKLQQNSENEEYVILSNASHVCQIKSFDKVILHPPEFEYMENAKGKPKIFIFDKKNKNDCYVFYKQQQLQQYFMCRGCDNICQKLKKQKKANTGKIVAGKLIKNEKTEKYFFQMKPNQIHICKPIKYQPEKYQIPPKIFDFFFYRPKSKPESLQLAIRHPEKTELCFTFYYSKTYNFFRCYKCETKKRCYTIRLQKDAHGKEYFSHDLKNHICEPIKTSTISPPKFIILKEHGLKPFELIPKQKPKIKIDESKIVRIPNFEFRPNKDGIPDKKLIIFHPTDKSLCYEFGFQTHHQNFMCRKCEAKKKVVSAKLHRNDKSDEMFILMGKNDHVCEPRKYQPL